MHLFTMLMDGACSLFLRSSFFLRRSGPLTSACEEVKRFQSADFDRSLQTGSRSLQNSRSADLLQQLAQSQLT